MDLMGLIIWLLIGLAAGYLAGVVMKGQRPFGLIGDLILGLLGAVVGGFLLGLLGFASGGLIASLVTAFIGAVVLIFLVRLIKR
ncbi:MAG: GlsB/YeaQ/YmgE family stress response membrane protein [Pseudomonadota bacterium]